MSAADIDILMVSYDRPEYTRLSLPRLLETCDETMRVWLWHNGEHEETLEIVRAHADHPRVHAFHHCRENQRLRAPTNWLWSRSSGAYVSKVDDDILMPDGWAQRLRAAHEAEARLGVVGCWSYRPEDHRPEVARRKVVRVGGGQEILQNCWTEGAGHLIKRACLEQGGPLAEGQSFTNWCIHRAAEGWLNGWVYPFVYMENMDDPRSPHARYRTEEEFQALRGLSTTRWGVSTLEENRRRQPENALELQRCSTDPWHYIGWRARLRRVLARVGVSAG